MRLMIAGMAALVAVAFAAPSFAQQEETAPAATPAPVPATKSKPVTAAYCQKLKTSTSRTSCMKKVQAQATPKAPGATTTTAAKKTKKTTTTPAAPKQPDVGQLTPPAAAPAPTSSGSVYVPPLPQKTI